MSTKRSRYKRPLKLHEIVDELENIDDDAPIQSSIAILPPENANSEITDEDSREEDNVTIQNLPGSQLRAEAEIQYDESSSDEEDDIPLSELSKRRRTVSDVTSNSSSPSPINVPPQLPQIPPQLPQIPPQYCGYGFT